MNEGIPIAEARKLYHEVEEMIQKLERGELSACACMGPMYDEPYCSCEMVSRGLERSPRVAIEEAEAKTRWEKLFEPGGWFYEEEKRHGHEEQYDPKTSQEEY